MRSCLSVLFSLLAGILVTVRPECCNSVLRIYYEPMYANCARFGGWSLVPNDESLCKISVCDDGTTVDGHFCGKDSCNVFGCDCDGGCRRGDPALDFQWIHGPGVRNVRYDL